MKFKALHEFSKDSPLRLYGQRIEDSATRLSESYRKIKESRQAYDNEMPDSMKSRHAGKAPDVNGKEIAIRNSTYLPPYASSTINLRAESMLANLPTLSYYITDPSAQPLKMAISKKVKDIYTLGNISLKIQEIYRTAEIDGICVSQTVCKPKIEQVRMPDGSIEEWETGRYIDIIHYDSLTTFFDTNANRLDIRGTAEWCVVTLGFFSGDYIAVKYGIDMNTFKSVSGKEEINRIALNSAMGGGNVLSSAQPNDAMLRQLQMKSGFVDPNSIPVREYYLNDGTYYTIIGDTFVVTETDDIYNYFEGKTEDFAKYANNGSMGILPINFTVLCPSPNGLMGTSLHHQIEPTVSPLAALFNQILDASHKNLAAPLYTTASNLSHMTVPFHKQNMIVEIPNIGKEQDLQKMFYQPSYTIDPVAIDKVMGMLTTLLNMQTRTPDVAYGFQDKQIRNEAAANLLGGSMIRNSSFLVTMFEFTFMNPFAKDVLRCFYKYFESFGSFDYEEEGELVTVSKEELKKIHSIHVENGSTLESAQQTRLGKASVLLNLITNPMAAGVMKHKEIIKEFLDSLGVEARMQFIKTAEEIVSEIGVANDLPNVVRGN